MSDEQRTELGKQLRGDTREPVILLAQLKRRTKNEPRLACLVVTAMTG